MPVLDLHLTTIFGLLLPLFGCGDDTLAAGAGGAGGTTSTSTGMGGQTTTTATGAGGSEFIPDADSIQFTAVNPLPDGEQILFNDWNAVPNTLLSMMPDGAGAITIFEAYRIWSMGVSNDAATIAFASGDPGQVEHYGIDLGDAIQHTFLYDVATEAAAALLWGNVNDECHTFSDDGASLYVCRRSDFRFEDEFWLSEGYDVARVDVASGNVELLLADDDDVMTLSPQPNASETTLLFQWIDLPSTRSIRSLDVASGDIEILIDAAGSPVLSPNGARFLYTDYADLGSLWAADLDGGNPIQVAAAQTSGPRWSPDGLRVVYMVGDEAQPCSHVDVVAADGSEANAPQRIRDCVVTGEFITEIAWITR